MHLGKYIMTCVHDYSIMQNSSTVLKILCVLPINLSLLQPLAITDLLTVSVVLPSPECNIVGIIPYVTFQIGFPHLVMLRFFHIFSQLDSPFLLVMNNIPLSRGITVYTSSLPTEGHLVPSKFWQL